MEKKGGYRSKLHIQGRCFCKIKRDLMYALPVLDFIESIYFFVVTVSFY